MGKKVAGELGCLVRLTGLVSLVLAMHLVGASRAQTLNPTRVVNTRNIAPVDLSTWRIADVAQSNGRWAVLLRGGPGLSRTAIVTGDTREEQVSFPIGAFDRIILDRDHAIHLRREGPRRDATEVAVWKPGAGDITTRIIPEPQAEPVLSDGMIEWKPARGRRTDPDNRRTGPAQHRPGDEWALAIPERRFVCGLPSRRYMVFGSRTEEVVVFNGDGAVASIARADLDSAYASLGLRVPKPDIESGRSRVAWATSSPEGLLYVDLSETPMTQPSRIAVFDPNQGRFLRVISAVHPTSEESIAPGDVAPIDSSVRGAVGDQLVIVYGRGYIALY